MKNLILIAVAILSIAATKDPKDEWSWEETTQYLRDHSISCVPCTDYIVEDFFADLEVNSLAVDTEQPVNIRFVDMAELPEESRIKDMAAWAPGRITDSYVEIYIDIDEWVLLTDIERYMLLYHELSHDLLDSDHVDDPKHIMYPEADGHIPADFDELNEMIYTHFTEVYDSW